MKLEDIHAFVAVVRSASITGAAEALFTRQPAITRRVQSLEKDLGVVLLDRNVKPSRPTQIGRRVYELCLNVVRDIALIDEFVREDAAPSGRLRLGVAEVLAEIALLDAVPGLRREYPDVQIDVASGWSTEIVASLLEGEMDGSIAVLPEGARFDSGFSSVSIGVLPMVVVAQKGAVSGRKRLAELHGMEWILSPEGCGFRDILRRAFSDLGMPFAVRISTFGTEQKLGLVARGAGLGFVPERMLEASEYLPQLQRVEIVDFQPIPHIWRVHPDNLGRLAACVHRFGEAIIEALASPGPARSTRHRTRQHRRAADERKHDNAG
ncbi:LysR family transcriptional regulator [Paraburkholderia susongensis]|uniref:DNA-binding transcriptional regulator, LysR family n=1 Tax=Paraburkholderia susongensis TaxID=1515439 RepID=A0A1X7LJ76_9BURK|nr:LysR family transcriptional regulator [Paraburkholderia susongensis]SMG53239.1 DNA-binding transcriptional regulator, LysR family [Paraburkholderia susongensis]